MKAFFLFLLFQYMAKRTPLTLVVKCHDIDNPSLMAKSAMTSMTLIMVPN